ncbi:MAG: hypothetical protein UIM53_02765 [Acutalibacteraceae bacterium]|nr:hypothetical protein [Acutalibacteraceae bacterium]
MKNLKEAKEQLLRLQAEREKLLAAIQDMDKQIMSLKMEIVDIVVNTDEENKLNNTNEDNKISVVRVEFKPNGKQYDYLWNHNTLPGEYVLVPSFDGEIKAKVKGFFNIDRNPEINYKKARPYKED